MYNNIIIKFMYKGDKVTGIQFYSFKYDIFVLTVLKY